LIGLLASGGCRHLQTEVSTTENVLRQAEACRQIQDFECAARLLAPAGRMAADPRLLYLAGLVAVDTRNPGRDYQAAREYFQQVATAHAEAPLAADAGAWLALIDEVRTQAEALERLEAANTSLQMENEAQKTRLSRMAKRLERLKAVDLSME
jgi:hypothetical protein